MERLFKILIIGDREVGRRSFLRVSTEDKRFDEVSAHIETLGVSVYRQELNVEEFINVLQIWNVSNKVSFNTLLELCVNGSNGVLLMFDITNSSTLDFLSRYPRLIREKVGDVPILLVGNKVDLGRERVISKEEGTDFAQANDLMGYIEISAKTGQNCENIFKILAENMLNQIELH